MRYIGATFRINFTPTTACPYDHSGRADVQPEQALNSFRSWHPPGSTGRSPSRIPDVPPGRGSPTCTTPFSRSMPTATAHRSGLAGVAPGRHRPRASSISMCRRRERVPDACDATAVRGSAASRRAYVPEFADRGSIRRASRACSITWPSVLSTRMPPPAAQAIVDELRGQSRNRTHRPSNHLTP